tara:strand:+ start:20 stop:1846 length:1827 start_codon:yes stop_codon:yes gene_type:complete
MPGASLDRAVSEERNFRADSDYRRRYDALMSFLGGDRSPNAQQGASEFVENYPDMYYRIRQQRQAGGTISVMQTPEERKKALDEAAERMAIIAQDMPESDPDAFLRSMTPEQQERHRKAKAEREKRLEELRRRRASRLEERDARGGEDRRRRFIDSARRYLGNPRRLEGELRRWNEKNPGLRVTEDDLTDLSGGGVVRPGDIAEVSDPRSLRSQSVAAGAIINGPSGPARIKYNEQGQRVMVPVLTDGNTGAFLPDPDKYNTQEMFDNAVTRQDRVNIRKGILTAGDARMAQEQRRLDTARDAALKHDIPEARDKAIAEIERQEAALHWRYMNGQADLQTMPTVGGGSATMPNSGRYRGPNLQDTYDAAAKVREELVKLKYNTRGYSAYGLTAEQIKNMTDDQLAAHIRPFLVQQYERSLQPIAGEGAVGSQPQAQPQAQLQFQPPVQTQGQQFSGSPSKIAEQILSVMDLDTRRVFRGLAELDDVRGLSPRENTAEFAQASNALIAGYGTAMAVYMNAAKAIVEAAGGSSDDPEAVRIAREAAAMAFSQWFSAEGKSPIERTFEDGPARQRVYDFIEEQVNVMQGLSPSGQSLDADAGVNMPLMGGR